MLSENSHTMESNQVAFIEGFVKQCAARGWTADQTSRALALVQLEEQLQDPDFAAGFSKQAASMQELLGAAGRWATDTSRPMNQVIAGAGIGGLGGLIFGGKNRFRNALLGAGAGGLAGLGANKLMQGGAPTTSAPASSKVPDFKDGLAAAEMANSFQGKIEAPDMRTPEVYEDSQNATLGLKSTVPSSGEQIGRLRQIAADPTRSPQERIDSARRLQEMQASSTPADSVGKLLAQGAGEGLNKYVGAPLAAVGTGAVDGFSAAGEVGKQLKDRVVDGFNSADLRVFEAQKANLTQRMEEEMSKAIAGDQKALERAEKLRAQLAYTETQINSLKK